MSDRRVVLSSGEYRVVTDRYSGYEAQYRKRWWPFWRIISWAMCAHMRNLKDLCGPGAVLLEPKEGRPAGFV